MIKFLIESPVTYGIWMAAEDAISLSQQTQTEVVLLFNDVLLRVRHDRDSIMDVYNDYQRKAHVPA